MFQVGDRVVYGIHGICRILDQEEQLVNRKRIRYFILEPLDRPGTRYLIPSENPAALAKLRPIISREELEALLSSADNWRYCWIDDANLRKQRYRELINSGDRGALLGMVCALYQHKVEQAAVGRKFHLCDENFLRDARKLLDAEFSLVLGIQPSVVETFIISALGIA